MRENRKHARIETRLRCWCEGENVTFYARIGNLSEGGLFLRTNTPLRVGVTTQLRLAVEDEQPVEARASVVWSRGPGGDLPSGMGLRFDSADVRALETIGRLVYGETQRRVG